MCMVEQHTEVLDSRKSVVALRVGVHFALLKAGSAFVPVGHVFYWQILSHGANSANLMKAASKMFHRC